MIRDYGMFWSSVVEAASLLSHLPIWSSPLFLSSSFTPSFPLSSAFHASLTVLPWNICHTSIFNSFLPSALLFARQIHALIFCSLFPPPPSNLLSLSVRQDKLSEEVQKQHDGPVEKGSLPVTQAELDPRLLLNPEHDASQAEEDKDKTKLLLERLKALEVLTRHHAFLLSL